MKYLISDAENANYLAKVAELKEVEKVPGTDRLYYTTIDNRTVIIDDSYQVGDVIVYFPSGCKINGELLSSLNAFRNENLNADPNPDKTGFFEDNGRVKMIKLQKMYSEGYIIRWNLFEAFLYDKGIKGVVALVSETFDSVEQDKVKLQICEKYVVKIKESGASMGSKRAKKSAIELICDDQFKFHVKVTRMGEVAWKLTPEKHINVSCKYHGTSGISANILCKRELGWWETKFKKWFGFKFQEQEYKDVAASRTIIKGVGSVNQDAADFRGFDIWNHVHNLIKSKLWQGMTLYYEIVGYTPGGKIIQKGYDYGYKAPVDDKIENYKMGENFGVKVYRITLTDPKGKVFEWSMNQIEDFCQNTGLETPLVYFDGKVSELIEKDRFDNIAKAGEWVGLSTGDPKDIYNYFATMNPMEKDCPICKTKVPFEGVVIRFEGKNRYDAFKLKCKAFDERESKALDKGESNMEDEA